ncbi:MAG: hypothetical protein IJI68_08740 [Eggerthellaceae bacterium]|nr:hypothetical protein [Eggerthellaceae bacterium]
MKRVFQAVLVFALLLAGTLLASCSPGGGEGTIQKEAQQELLAVHFGVEYESNIIFAKYDVDIAIDGKVVGTVSQGDSYTHVVDLSEGTHEVSFRRAGESDSYADTRFNLKEESYYECRIKAHDSSIDINDELFEPASARTKRVAQEKAAAQKAEEEKKAAEEKAEKERKEAEEKAEQERKEAEEKAEKERKEAEEKAEQECLAAEAERQSVADEFSAYVGKSVGKAVKHAKDLGYSYDVKDSEGWSITSEFDSSKKGSKYRKAKVKEVKVEDSRGDVLVVFSTDYEKVTVDVDSLVGLDLTEAAKKLEEAEIEFEVIGEITRDDLTSVYKNGDYDGGGMIVTGADDLLDVVTLEVLSQEQIDERKAKASAREILESKLELYAAWAAVEMYGKAAYGSSFKVHYVLGILAEEPLDENTWFLKATCDIGDFSGNCEAKVTGTTDYPEVYDFYVY